MYVWRITRGAFQALDGEGARLNGGRWSVEGAPVVYTSTTLALAALEYLVHVDPADVPDDLVAMRLHVPDDVPQAHVRVSDLPKDWNRVPDHPACLDAGARWLSGGRAAVLRVPSAIVPEDENVLIDPRHASAVRIEVEQVRGFAFDPRLLT